MTNEKPQSGYYFVRGSVIVVYVARDTARHNFAKSDVHPEVQRYIFFYWAYDMNNKKMAKVNVRN